MTKDLTGKTIVITGGSSGIGAAAARILRQRGAQVVITGRSAETKKLAEEIGCDYYLVDYTRFAEVRSFAQKLLEQYPRIDVLVNNVGGIIADRRVTADGHEMTLQVNHLSGFLLTHLLRERLEASKAIVINTSSAANLMGRINFDDLESEKNYKSFRAYGAAKQMNILHAAEISRRFKGVWAASFHPGVVETGFAREGGSTVKWLYESTVKRFFMISPEQGADTLIWLISTTPGKDWQDGQYYYKRRPGRKNPQVVAGIASRLWEVSERLTGANKPEQV
ncbi:SDR family NAD(P)-dependent oxidoreductase [Pontibacter sp. BAB1700]|uniref:SDR family NAD(P)-dependent oxidoreductase n=1 Tax=Pontibacter sp. BAB1700 TaxID=1144253 RepID=UPI00026BBDF0|nr:SDR family NAD(P)-dependent oxidoreductase [Pontibacter sp. BAB1700]EJF08112.1 short-chain dehydrogenase/reductase SDR [Pontibacter sp. BAB1700]